MDALTITELALGALIFVAVVAWQVWRVLPIRLSSDLPSRREGWRGRPPRVLSYHLAKSRPGPRPVAQWIEHRFPEPFRVVGLNPRYLPAETLLALVKTHFREA